MNGVRGEDKREVERSRGQRMTVYLESGAIGNQFGASLNAVAAGWTGCTSACRPHVKPCNEQRPHPPPGGFHCSGGPHKVAPPPHSMLSLMKCCKVFHSRLDLFSLNCKGQTAAATVFVFLISLTNRCCTPARASSQRLTRPI